MRQWVGSILFTLFLFGSVPFYGAVALLTAPLPRRYTYGVAMAWVSTQLWLLRVLCRLDYAVEGREHLPSRSSIVLTTNKVECLPTWINRVMVLQNRVIAIDQPFTGLAPLLGTLSELWKEPRGHDTKSLETVST